MLRAGSLKHRISIMSNTQTKNEFGEVINNFIESTSTRASISPYTGNESFSGSVKNTVTHKITVNGKIQVTAEDEIVYDGRTFKIVYVLNWNELNREKLILAIEKMDK